MTPGAHLSHAARCVFDAQRAFLTGILHIEAVDAEITDLDDLLLEVQVSDIDFAQVLTTLGDLAGDLQHVAEAYGQREALRAFNRHLPQVQEVVAQ
jgi:hypothetical protein